MPPTRSPYFLCSAVSAGTATAANWIQGRQGPVMEMESRLALRGADFLFRNPSGDVALEARQPMGFTLWRRCLYELHRDGEVVARVQSAILPLVNPAYRIEVPGNEPLAVWKGLLGGEISVTRRGAEVLHIDRPVVERSLFHGRETRDLFVSEEEDVPVLLALSLLLIRPSGT